MKRITALLICAAMLLSLSLNCFAYAVRGPREDKDSSANNKDIIYYEDFSAYEEGGLPKNMKISQNETNKIEVVSYTTPDAEKKNVLKFTDASTTTGSSLSFQVPQIDEPITLEMRIKHVKTAEPGFGFIMNFQDDAGTNAFRIVRFNSANAPYTYVSYSGNDKNFTSSTTNGMDHNDSWFKITVRIDNELKQTGVIIENEQIISDTTLNSARYPNIFPDPERRRVLGFKLPWLSDQIEGVTKITFMPYTGSTGEHYIDYIKFSKNVPEILPIRKRADSKEITVVADPAKRLYPDIVNFVFKDEITYMSSPVTVVNNRAMADAESFGALYGLKLTEEEGRYKLSGETNTIDFSADSASFSLNGKNYTADIAPKFIEGVLYIPIKNFATALGDEVIWSTSPKCVTVK